MGPGKSPGAAWQYCPVGVKPYQARGAVRAAGIIEWMYGLWVVRRRMLKVLGIAATKKVDYISVGASVAQW